MPLSNVTPDYLMKAVAASREITLRNKVATRPQLRQRRSNQLHTNLPLVLLPNFSVKAAKENFTQKYDFAAFTAQNPKAT